MSEFTKCLSIPNFLGAVFSIAAFVIAYALYRVLLFVFRRFIHKERVGAKLVQELRYPILMILLQVAAFLSLQFLNLPEVASRVVSRTLDVVMIGTFGWLIVGITRAFYRNYVEKIGDGMSADSSHRSNLTQILFLYRFLIFAIVSITIAAILMTFPYIKTVGVGILGSAGIAGIALGIAARPILLNLMAGFQIAATKMLKIGDAIMIEGDLARIESIHLTHVIVVTWDLRRIILPISYFIDKPFQNWDTTNSELLGSVMLYCDYTVPVDAIRKKAEELITAHPNWNKRMWNVQVTDCTDKAIEIRILASANGVSSTFSLRTYLREKLVDFLQKEYPHALPNLRNMQVPEPKHESSERD